MPLYEHVFIARQDISNSQADALTKQFEEILTENGGEVVGSEYWGFRKLAYKIKKNRKGHYIFMKTKAPPAAVHEMERRMGLHDDVMRVLTLKVKAHSETPSAMLQKR